MGLICLIKLIISWSRHSTIRKNSAPRLQKAVHVQYNLLIDEEFSSISTIAGKASLREWGGCCRSNFLSSWNVLLSTNLFIVACFYSYSRQSYKMVGQQDSGKTE